MPGTCRSRAHSHPLCVHPSALCTHPGAAAGNLVANRRGRHRWERPSAPGVGDVAARFDTESALFAALRISTTIDSTEGVFVEQPAFTRQTYVRKILWHNGHHRVA